MHNLKNKDFVFYYAIKYCFYFTFLKNSAFLVKDHWWWWSNDGIPRGFLVNY